MTALGLLASLVAVSSSGVAHEDADVCTTVARSRTTERLHLVYVKSDQMLCMLDQHEVLWQRAASHGREPGKKASEGDNRTPEGRYVVSPARTSKRFGLFLALSYPNAEDRKAARARGRPPGGDVGIHGPQSWYSFLGRAQALFNHSDGCIVLDEGGVRELASRVTKPVSIDVLPSLP